MCSCLWLAKVTRYGSCCLLLHALSLPQQLAVRCRRWWRRRRRWRRRSSSSRRPGWQWGLFLLAGAARFERKRMLQHIMLLPGLLLRVLIELLLLHQVAHPLSLGVCCCWSCLCVFFSSCCCCRHRHSCCCCCCCGKLRDQLGRQMEREGSWRAVRAWTPLPGRMPLRRGVQQKGGKAIWRGSRVSAGDFDPP